MRAWIVAVVLLGGLVRAPEAEACSCRARGAPCATLFRGTTFVGRVVSTAEKNDQAVTTFEVIETLFSPFSLGKRADVSHGTDGAACGISFVPGAIYVVDAGGSWGALGTGLCSATHEVTGKLADDPAVKYARASTTRTKAVVDGVVTVRDGDKNVPLSGVTLRVKGTTRTVTSTTGGKLHFEIAPGTYELEVATPGMATWRGETFPVDVQHPAACAHPEVDVFWDGHLDGRVTDAAGQPVPDLRVGALSATGKRTHELAGYTDANGRYSIKLVPPGSFRVGVAIPELGGTSKDTPYAPTYHPAASSPSKATLVNVKQGAVTSGLDIVLGPPIPPRGIKITVVHADRKPAIGATVRIGWVSGIVHTESVDGKGVYTLTEYDGAQVELHACFEIERYYREICADAKHTVNGDAAIVIRLPVKPKR